MSHKPVVLTSAHRHFEWPLAIAPGARSQQNEERDTCAARCSGEESG